MELSIFMCVSCMANGQGLLIFLFHCNMNGYAPLFLAARLDAKEVLSNPSFSGRWRQRVTIPHGSSNATQSATLSWGWHCAP